MIYCSCIFVRFVGINIFSKWVKDLSSKLNTVSDKERHICRFFLIFLFSREGNTAQIISRIYKWFN